MERLDILRKKVKWVRMETLKLHKKVSETRLASSLSPIELLVTLFYGNFLKFDPETPYWEERDRFIISKGHGSISFYPILADLGYFGQDVLDKIGEEDSILGAIPDTVVPGYETINGSVGHGLGVACGIALGVRNKKLKNKVFVLAGDGELNAGAVWEAIAFAAFHHLRDLILVVDDNKKSMLGWQKEILNLGPLRRKFEAFDWYVEEVDGHDIQALLGSFKKVLDININKPKVILANTVKGHGVPEWESDPICHIRALSAERIDELLQEEEDENGAD
jgi:transketolase